MDQWATVDAEDYERVNQYEWFGMFLERTQSIHAVRAIEVEKGRFQLELMEEFIVGLHPRSKFICKKTRKRKNKTK